MLFFARWKVTLILLVCLAGIVLTAPNLLTREQAAALPRFLPHQQLNLGLDLRGGSHLLLEVDVTAVLKERVETLLEGARAELRRARINYIDLAAVDRGVSLKLREPAQMPQALEILRKLANPVGGDGAFGLGTGRVDLTVNGAPDGAITMVLSEQAVRERAGGAVQQSIEIVRRRVDAFGVAEPSIQRQGANRILVQVPGLQDPQRLKELIGKTAKMTFRLVDVEASTDGRPPPGSEILDEDTSRSGGVARKWVVKRKIEVAGDALTDARPGQGQSGEWVVNFKFNSVGASRFAQTTRENVGKPFAVVLDDKVITAPVIREPILGGSGQISGSFDAASSNDLAVLLRAGALPAPLKIVEERTVGPDLGADAIRAGVLAVIVGFALVVVYMIAAYGLFGSFAVVALVMNLLLILGVLSLMQATLTLPGIAGILLTIGMSVDANVLINERIREEVKLGKTPVAALEAGFNRAMSTIVDANLTSLIKMLLLFAFGTGAVKGFAVTISVGILTSMFTAITLVRLLISWWYRARRPAALAV
jgi:preprotein translocase subunit SecD